MASSYPSTFDSTAGPSASDKTNSVTYPHATLHDDAINRASALQHKVGLSTSGAGASSYPSTNVGDHLMVNSTGGQTGWGVPPYSFRNRLVNGDMRVKQRGTLSTVDNQYTLDRWRAVHEGGMIVTQETSDVPSSTTLGGGNRALKFQFDGSSGHKGGIFQPIETFNCEDLRGQVASLQFKAKVLSTALSELRAAIVASTNSSADDATLANDPINAWGGGSTNPTYTGSWVNVQSPSTFTPSTNYSLHKIENVTISTGIKNLAAFIWSDDTSNSTADGVLISDVQLERGAYCSHFERRPIGLEIEMAQRYYEEMGGNAANENLGSGLHITNGESIVNIPFKVRKRVTPSLSVSASTDFFVYAGPTPSTSVSITTQSISPDFVGLRPTGSSATTPLTVGEGTCFAAKSTAGRLKFSAEL